MKTYEKTHPWINFKIDTQRFPYALWIALGEASSKCEHIAGVPLSPEIAKKIHHLYLIKGALATTAIEGNTLSEDEVKNYLDGKLRLPLSRQYLGQEIDNVVAACNELARELRNDGSKPFTPEAICKMNAIILKDLPLNEDVVPGEIRRHNVTAGRYRCAPADDCKHLLGMFCKHLNDFKLPEENSTVFALIKAIFAHLFFVWIHPFGDGNGRTARIIELSILLSAGLPQPTCHLLSNHYNLTRSNYYRFLDKAIHGDEHVIAFFQYAITGFVDGLREHIDRIRSYQEKVAWISYVHEKFTDRKSKADIRRRTLALALGEAGGFIAKNKIYELTATLSSDYRHHSVKLTRDMNELISMDLIETNRHQARAKTEVIQAFKVWRNPEPA
ncbi:MAG: Fic family protein [Rhodospirillales bacterium]|nr:Fic family protein [Rhodospirillales bacterium]